MNPAPRVRRPAAVRRWTALAAAFVLAAVAAPLALPAPLGVLHAAAAESPRETIEVTVTRVIEILKDRGIDTAARRHRIEEVAYQRFDFDTLSRLVLARNWSTLSKEQQARFIDEFKQHLSVTYGRNIDSYSNEKVILLGDREEARGDWSVKTKIARGGGNDDILVDYRLRRLGDQWKIIDVVIEGVSLVANFRAQFQEILANGGPDRLLTLLAEKNAKGESILPPGKSGSGDRATGGS